MIQAYIAYISKITRLYQRRDPYPRCRYCVV